jgi:hypothetical protein
MSVNKPPMDLHGTRKAPNVEVHGGIKAINGDIRVAKQHQGTMRNNLRQSKPIRNNRPTMNLPNTRRAPRRGIWRSTNNEWGFPT